MRHLGREQIRKNMKYSNSSVLFNASKIHVNGSAMYDKLYDMLVHMLKDGDELI